MLIVELWWLAHLQAMGSSETVVAYIFASRGSQSVKYVLADITTRKRICILSLSELCDYTQIAIANIVRVSQKSVSHIIKQQPLLPQDAKERGAQSARLPQKVINSEIAKKIPWKKCLDVCTDGAKSMTGSIKGVVSRINPLNGGDVYTRFCQMCFF